MFELSNEDLLAVSGGTTMSRAHANANGGRGGNGGNGGNSTASIGNITASLGNITSTGVTLIFRGNTVTVAARSAGGVAGTGGAAGTGGVATD